jgi:hypothetical protein
MRGELEIVLRSVIRQNQNVTFSAKAQLNGYATWIRAAITGTSLVAALAACTAGGTTPNDPDSSVSSASAAPSPSASPAAAPEDLADPHEAATAAFARFMDAFVAASAIPDPASPDLATAATGDALQAVTAALQTNLEAGERSEGEPGILTVTVTESALDTDPIQVVIASCQDTTTWLTVNAETGEPVADEEYGRRHIEALVEQLDGRWYVTGTC